MFCCSRKTLYILLAVAGLIALLMATGKVNAYAIVPFLPILICPLMCGVMLLMGRKGDGASCEKPGNAKGTDSSHHKA